MKLTFLGTGTSHGIPVVACECKTCKSRNKKDKRLRASVLISDEDTNILVDCGPEFRIQALNINLRHLDAVLLTHSHADHLHGIDDLRVFSCRQAKTSQKKTDKNPLNIFANTETISDFKYRFAYLFAPVNEGGGRAFINLCDTKKFNLQNPIKIGKIKIFPVPMIHGETKTTGYIFSAKNKTIVYLTDCNKIPEKSIEIINTFKKIDYLVIDGLRIRKHSTHFSFSEAMEQAEKIAAKHTYFTHICHDSNHNEILKWIADNINLYPTLSKIVKKGGSVEVAYDGLELE